MDSKDVKHRRTHKIYSARIMAGNRIGGMHEVCRQLLKSHQEGFEVTSPKPVLAPDDVSERSRASSDWSCVDCRFDGKDFCQELIGLVQAEVDEHAVRFIQIIESKNRRISELKRQLAKTQSKQR